jgi:hypothetical protein
MRSTTVFAAAATLAIGFTTAQNFDDDYPAACRSVCAPIVTRSDSCDNQFDNDRDELNCICAGPNMNNLVPQCQACIARNNGDDNDDDDLEGTYNWRDKSSRPSLTAT